MNSYVLTRRKYIESSSLHDTDRDGPNYDPVHVLIVADPQILDHRSYPTRAPILAFLTRLIVDMNLRKSWRAALRTRPHAVVFLGDMMDSGRFAMSDDEYVVLLPLIFSLSRVL
jgi:hypothetical protein